MILLGVIVGATVAIVIYCRPVYFIPGKFKKKFKNSEVELQIIMKGGQFNDSIFINGYYTLCWRSRCDVFHTPLNYRSVSAF